MFKVVQIWYLVVLNCNALHIIATRKEKVDGVIVNLINRILYRAIQYGGRNE